MIVFLKRRLIKILVGFLFCIILAYISLIQVKVPGWEPNKSRDINLYIHPDKSTSIISPSDLCSTAPFLMIVICSAVRNEKQRMSIRNTWGSKENLIHSSRNKNVKIAFILGQSDDKTLNDEVIKESSKYSDIIQEKFLDTYNNLTLKSVMMLNWINSFCLNATYIMKTDDDMYINLPELIKSLTSREKAAGTLIGYLHSNIIPVFNPFSKWYMPKYMYSESRYPDFVRGTGYVMSLDVALKLFETALKTPLLHLEDVYLTGICAKKAKLRPVNHPGFHHNPQLHYYKLKKMISIHHVDSDFLMNYIHDKIVKPDDGKYDWFLDWKIWLGFSQIYLDLSVSDLL